VPRYREALMEKLPCLGIHEEKSDSKTAAMTMQTENA
jgi:hypothetical protein